MKISDSGFTLAEVMVASLIFTVVAVSLISAILFALANRFASRVESAELRLTQSKIEEFKSRTYQDPVFSNFGSPLNADGDIDFDASGDPQTTSFSQVILNQSRNTKLSFETRYNILSLGSRKLVTVATRKVGGSTPKHRPSNLKILIAP